MGNRFGVSVSAIALSAATAKTVAEITAGSNTPVVIKKWAVTFNGTSSTAVPALVEVGQASAGVTTATTITANPKRLGSAVAAAVCKHTTTSEGAYTFNGYFEQFYVPITSGLIMPYVEDDEVQLAKSGVWHLRITSPTATSVSVDFDFEE